jgi:serine/threonine-protein kinase RsbW
MQTVRFPGIYTSLKNIGEFVGQAAKDAGLDAKAIYSVQVAVDEACANVIDHAYGGEGKGEIEITCDDIGNGLSVIIRDWGRSFDPSNIPEPDFTKPLNELPSRGAGLMFMRRHMDKVRFNFSKQEGNTCTMVKKK